MYKSILRSVVIVFTSLFSYSAGAQIITTLAGSGALGYDGDGDLAIYGSMTTPAAMAVDKAGNVYFCDQANNAVRKVDIYGIVSTFAGIGVQGMSGDGGPATAARVFGPGGIALDKAGNIFFSDSKNNRIRKVDTAGIITTVAGNGLAGFKDTVGVYAEMSYPLGLAIDTAGNIYFADAGTNRIRKINSTTLNVTTIAGDGHFIPGGEGGPATASAAGINVPYSVVVNSRGEVYFSDHNNEYIRKVDTSGILINVAGTGYAGFGGDGGVSYQSMLREPTQLAIDSKDNIYVVDCHNNRVRMIDTAGIINTVAGTGELGTEGDGGLAKNANLFLPTSIALDANDNFYIGGADNRIRYVYAGDSVKNDISIYPNPCEESTYVFISSPYEEIATIQLVSTTGQVIETVYGPTNRRVRVRIKRAGFYIVYAVTKHARVKGKVSAGQY